MAYEVLARKWRPQQFEDVVGQDHVVRTLRNAIESKRIAHAYLFVGPRGIGKTSIARIFAKSLNCETGPTIKPCGTCDSCREITGGNSLDVMEIDGASNNSVDQVRDLRETVKYMPAHGSYKIYIIDEVHMLSVAAFNALLKTLEEPPPHVKFFFATTEPERILPTIVSRCQRFDLRRIPVQTLVERLKLIAKAEKVKIADDALLAIARGAEGGLRDAESALDQLISFKGTDISEEDVLSVFGLISRKTLEELAENILTGNAKALLDLVEELDSAGKDIRRLVMELMEHFRNLLVCLHASDMESHMDLTDSQIATLKKQAQLADTERVLRVTGILDETEDRMKRALSRRALIETALIRCARAATVVSLDEILAKINALRRASPADAGNVASVGDFSKPAPTAKEPAPSEKASRAQEQDDANESAVEETAAPIASGKPTGDATAPAAEKPDDLQLLRRKWPEIMERIAKTAPFARNTLRDSAPLTVDGDNVVIGLDAEFAGEADKLEASRNKVAVERALSAALKRNVSIEFRVAELGETKSVAKKERADSGESHKQAIAADKGKKTKSAEDLAEHPSVKKTLDMFGGRVIDIRK